MRMTGNNKGSGPFSTPGPTRTIVGSGKLHENSQNLSISAITAHAHNDQYTGFACSCMDPTDVVAHACTYNPYGFLVICRKNFLEI